LKTNATLNIKQALKLTSSKVGFNNISAQGQGITLALLSTALFVLVGVLVRLLSESINVFEILLFRQLVFIILLLPAISINIQIFLKPRQVKLHILRVAGAFIALYFGFITVSHLPLANATALGFSQVLFVALLSYFLLGEDVGAMRIFTIITGFIGVMLVVEPNFGQTQLVYIMTGLAGAFGAAVAVICVRKMAQSQPKITLLTYQAVFVGLIALLPALLSWQWPTLPQLLQLIMVGVLSSIAQWIGISAYKLAQANIIANVEYIKIIYSLLLGFLLFGELPTQLALIGCAVILSSAALPWLVNRWRIRQHNIRNLPRH